MLPSGAPDHSELITASRRRMTAGGWQKEISAMKAIATIFESVLRQDDATVWTPADGPTEAAAGPRGTSWGWGG